MRHVALFLGGLLTMLTLLAPPARPDVGKAESGSKAAAAVHDGHAKAAEPPIFTPVRIDLAIWTVVVFLLLLAFLSKYAWTPMLQGLQKREDSIRSALEDAQRARDEAERLREEFQKEVQNAHEKVRDILEEGRRDAERSTQDMINKAKGDIQAERDRLRREIDTARDQALQELWTQAANLATMISHKVIRRELNEQDHRRLVDEALTELRTANVGWKERNIF